MRIPIVNEQDEIVCYKERADTTREDIRRIIGLIIYNEKGEVLIAKRQSNKAIDPDKWGPSVAGTVEEGETYDSNVVKEAEEELGLKNIKPKFHKKFFYETHNARRFTAWYSIQIPAVTELVLQKDEVAEVRWIHIPELEKWYMEKPEDFIPTFSRSIGNMKEFFPQTIHESKD